MRLNNAWIYRVECDQECDELIMDFRIKVPLSTIDDWRPLILEKDVTVDITDDRLQE